MNRKKRLSIMGFTAARPGTSGMSYAKRMSPAGANIIGGGTSTSIVGTPSRTGTIATPTATTITAGLAVAWADCCVMSDEGFPPISEGRCLPPLLFVRGGGTKL